METEKKLSVLETLKLVKDEPEEKEPASNSPEVDWDELTEIIELELDDKEEDFLPPRSELFPSNTEKVTHRLFSSLLIIFILLTVGLMVWGIYFND